MRVTVGALWVVRVRSNAWPALFPNRIAFELRGDGENEI